MTSEESCEAEHKYVDLEDHHEYYNTTIVVNKEFVEDLWVTSPFFQVFVKYCTKNTIQYIQCQDATYVGMFLCAVAKV